MSGELRRVARRRVGIVPWDDTFTGHFVLPVPHDCTDGFLGAYWRRPAAYLDSTVRAAISNLAHRDAPPVDEGLARLADDVASGAWHERYADLLALDELDLGYRLVVAELPAPGD